MLKKSVTSLLLAICLISVSFYTPANAAAKKVTKKALSGTTWKNKVSDPTMEYFQIQVEWKSPIERMAKQRYRHLQNHQRQKNKSHIYFFILRLSGKRMGKGKRPLHSNPYGRSVKTPTEM